MWRPSLEDGAWPRINWCVVYSPCVVGLHLDFKSRIRGVVELEGIVFSLIHWLSSRFRKGWITRDVLLERHFGDRAKRRRWLVDQTLTFRREGMMVRLFGCWLSLVLVRIASPSLVLVHCWLLQLFSRA